MALTHSAFPATSVSYIAATGVLAGTVTNPGGSVSGVTVSISVDGSIVGTATTASNGSWTYTPTVTNGQHKFSAAAAVTVTRTSLMQPAVTFAATVTKPLNEGVAAAASMTDGSMPAGTTYAVLSDGGTGATIPNPAVDSISIPAQTYYRDKRQQPFASSSPWNTPIGSGAIYEVAPGATPAAGSATAVIRASSAATSAYPFQVLAMGVYQAATTDPLVTITYTDSLTLSSGGSGTIQLNVPANFAPTSVDGWAILVSPDGDTYYEFWMPASPNVVKNSSGLVVSVTATRVEKNSLSGSGIAPTNTYNTSVGIRAAGVSLLGGLIRVSDIVAGAIKHAIAWELSPAQQKAGSTPSQLCTWPATLVDSNATSNYSGVVPMGSLFAIPASVNLATLGLTANGLMLARALQQYGAYDVDTATGTFMFASHEVGMPQSVINDLYTDMPKLQPLLTLVTNNTSAAIAAGTSTNPVAVGGGGTPNVTGPRALVAGKPSTTSPVIQASFGGVTYSALLALPIIPNGN